MFRDVPACSGMFHVPGFIDAPQPEAAQAHYRNADLTLARQRCCVTNGYLQSLVWDVNGFS